MKKIFLVFVSATMLVSAIEAQETGNAVAANINHYTSEYYPLNAINSNGYETVQSFVSKKVKREFSRFCKDAQNIYWEILSDGVIANYKTGDQKGRRLYNSRGNFVCNILYCGEKYLPNDVINILKNIYYQECEIIAAEEIKTPVNQFYFIYIKNKTGVKKLSICEGEIEVLQEYTN